MAALRDTWQFLRNRKKLWLPPLILMAAVAAGLFAVDVVARIVPIIHAFFRQ